MFPARREPSCGFFVPWIPSDEQIREWAGRLRAALPGWGVLYDADFGIWVAVRGRQRLVVASTPPKLFRRAAAADIMSAGDHGEVARLRADYPGWRIDRTSRHWFAVSRNGGPQREAVVLNGLVLSQLRRQLERWHRDCPDQTRNSLMAERDEPPQAIADDYPGWMVVHQNGEWTAWCPAVTVRAASAAELRALIEAAITECGEAE